MIRFLITVAIIAGLVYAGATIKLGKRTFFGHVQAIWATEEVQELKQGVEEKAGPAVEKVKRGVRAGMEEADRDAPAAATDAGVDGPIDAAPVVDAPAETPAEAPVDAAPKAMPKKKKAK